MGIPRRRTQTRAWWQVRAGGMGRWPLMVHVIILVLHARVCVNSGEGF
jgi:hypothetical protein